MTLTEIEHIIDAFCLTADRTRSVGASRVQRECKISYPEALAAIKEMQDRGIVEADAEKPWINRFTDATPPTLEERLKRVGMSTVAEVMAGAPLDRFHAHAGVRDLATFEQWLEMRRKEFATLHSQLMLNREEESDLFEWALAHNAAFNEVLVNFRRAIAGTN